MVFARTTRISWQRPSKSCAVWEELVKFSVNSIYPSVMPISFSDDNLLRIGFTIGFVQTTAVDAKCHDHIVDLLPEFPLFCLQPSGCDG